MCPACGAMQKKQTCPVTMSSDELMRRNPSTSSAFWTAEGISGERLAAPDPKFMWYLVCWYMLSQCRTSWQSGNGVTATHRGTSSERPSPGRAPKETFCVMYPLMTVGGSFDEMKGNGNGYLGKISYSDADTVRGILPFLQIPPTSRLHQSNYPNNNHGTCREAGTVCMCVCVVCVLDLDASNRQFDQGTLRAVSWVLRRIAVPKPTGGSFRKG